jgi:hypothetical protein
MLRVAFFVAGLVATGAACAGCNRSARLPVSGTVAVDGQPLASGEIAFAPASPGQGNSAGAAIERGKYSISAEQGLLPGDYKVSIHAFRGTGRKTWDGMGEPTAPESQKKYVEQLEQYIPSRYNEATELTASVRSGKSKDLNFDLQIGGGRSAK